MEQTFDFTISRWNARTYTLESEILQLAQRCGDVRVRCLDQSLGYFRSAYTFRVEGESEAVYAFRFYLRRVL